MVRKSTDRTQEGESSVNRTTGFISKEKLEVEKYNKRKPFSFILS